MGNLYRTLAQLELNGDLRSEWKTDKAGPARRAYRLTVRDERHLEERDAILEHDSKSMAGFVSEARRTCNKVVR
jgi:DNA-binding PadR family transcriptional regulator